LTACCALTSSSTLVPSRISGSTVRRGGQHRADILFRTL
jgi:hypothetical protein